MSSVGALKTHAGTSTASAAEPLTVVAIEKSHRDAIARLGTLRQRLAAQDESYERLRSGPITEADIAAHHREKGEIKNNIIQVEELVTALGAQLLQASQREWHERKSKRLAALMVRAAAADAKYKLAHEQLAALVKTVGELKAVHFEFEAFNRTSTPEVGYVELPERRIRIGGRWVKMLWDALENVPMVYPGDGLVKFPLPELPAEEALPKPPADQAEPTLPPAHPQPRFFGRNNLDQQKQYLREDAAKNSTQD